MASAEILPCLGLNKVFSKLDYADNSQVALKEMYGMSARKIGGYQSVEHLSEFYELCFEEDMLPSEPRRSLNAPANIVARASTHEFGKQYRGIHAGRRDRQFLYSRFRLCRTCRYDVSLLTCLTFLGNSDRIVTGSYSGEVKIFDTSNGNLLKSYGIHQKPVLMIQSAFLGDTQFILSSGTFV
ncbi:DDB1- and CUL4-associated factor like 1 [Dendrobium catenatum]|uniref:DDB1-and CUL4-associated factor like 1 n=1 Tax=Dendrobium catenatum TaxID=906689 RepID=A0A2I0V6R5_9ASPA|nr:DDB1- and CUL4-associated factor like 1 [Dendrobium catenatum]